MGWIPGFEQIPATHAGGTYAGAPWRLVLHSTEGNTVAGAVAAYWSSGSWPHFTVDPGAGRRSQHYDTGTAARALMHPPLSPATNGANAIQIEIVGYAANTIPHLTDDELDWLALDVVNPIRAVCPFRLDAPAFVPYPASYGIGAQRFTWNQWALFAGICGHEHVPGNDHGDPGQINVARIIATATGAHPSPPPPPVNLKDYPVNFVLIDNNAAYLVDTQSGFFAPNVPQVDAGSTPLPVITHAGAAASVQAACSAVRAHTA
jgi:hypothetical protein